MGLRSLFPALAIIQELLRYWIFGRAKLGNPLHHDLTVAEIAKTDEKLLAGLPHLFPPWIRINRLKSFCNGTAPPKRDAEVMDDIVVKAGHNLLGLFQNLFHPIAQTGFCSCRGWWLHVCRLQNAPPAGLLESCCD